MASREAADPRANRLLGLLSPSDYQRLRPHLHCIPLEYRQSLYRANKPIGFVYFIETGVGSLVNTMANGQAAEVGTIGNEGLVGLPLVFGDDRAPTSVYVQVPGATIRSRRRRGSRRSANNSTPCSKRSRWCVRRSTTSTEHCPTSRRRGSKRSVRSGRASSKSLEVAHTNVRRRRHGIPSVEQIIRRLMSPLESMQSF